MLVLANDVRSHGSPHSLPIASTVFVSSHLPTCTSVKMSPFTETAPGSWCLLRSPGVFTPHYYSFLDSPSTIHWLWSRSSHSYSAEVKAEQQATNKQQKN